MLIGYASYLVVCCQLWRLVSKVLVKKVQRHFILGMPAVGQKVVKAHGVVSSQDLLSLESLFEVLGGPFA